MLYLSLPYCCHFVKRRRGKIKFGIMRIEEAMVFVLASSNHGMKIDQIAKEINEKVLFTRWDKQPVDGRMIYAVVMSHPETFVKSDGLIRLMI